MTLDEAKKRVENIRLARGDDEVAHAMEDDLYSDFVQAVAKIEGPLQEVAKEILKTEQLDFARWTA